MMVVEGMSYGDYVVIVRCSRSRMRMRTRTRVRWVYVRVVPTPKKPGLPSLTSKPITPTDINHSKS